MLCKLPILTITHDIVLYNTLLTFHMPRVVIWVVVPCGCTVIRQKNSMIWITLL